MDRIFNYVFKVKQERLHGFLFTFLKKYYGIENIYHGTKFLMAKGTNPVALIAHLDTVHRQSNKDCLYYDPIKMVAWSPNGLVADDRAGVYAIIDIVKRGYRPHIIFTHDEESGGGGARQLTGFNLPFVPNFLLELDRRGYQEAVFYDCDNKDFQEKIIKYGFKLGHGTFSDISIISPVYDIASANLGIGYYNEHTTFEVLHVDEMFDTIARVIEIIEDEQDSTVAYNFQKKVYSYTNYNRTYYGNSTYRQEDDYDWDKWKSKDRNSTYVSTDEYNAKKNAERNERKEDSVSETNEKILARLELEDFDLSTMGQWTQKELDRYYDLLYAEYTTESPTEWYDRYYPSEKITSQGNEFDGDPITENINSVNAYLGREVMYG